MTIDTVVISILTSSLMATIVSLALNWWNAQQAAKAKERALIASLAGELRHSITLCEYNAKLKGRHTPPFVRFPTTVAIRATFEERHSFPKLEPFHKDLEHYTMGVGQINQMIELHDRLWASADPLTTPGPRIVSLEQLQDQIADICSGDKPLKGVGPEKQIIVPTFIKVVHKRIRQLR